MGQIKLLNSFKSNPKDGGGVAAISFNTKINNFSVLNALIFNTKSEINPLAFIGNTGIGSNISGQSAGAAASILVQFPSNSDIESIHAYGDFGWNGGGEEVKGVIWDNSGDVVAVTPEITGTEVASWHIMTFSSPVAVAGGVNYYIGTVEELDDVYIEFNVGNIYDGYLDDSNSFASPQSIGSPAGSEKLAIYATLVY
jgi:hypothetical protein